MNSKCLDYVCTHCGQPHIMHDAWARWNPATSTFELDQVFDVKFCTNCETTFHYLEPTTITGGK